MIGRLQRQASLFGFAFFKELSCLQDPTLGQIDLLLDDPELVAICSRALGGRRQRSMDFGARLSRGELSARSDAVLRVLRQENSLCHYLPLVERVIAQTQARVFEAQRHYPEKLLSLFEPHSVVIRKGKAHKPNEFGRLVRIDEVENGIVSGYEVAAGNRADQQQWAPALEHHLALFGRAPRLAAADRGYWSAQNERLAAELGVEQIVLPGRGPLSAERAVREKKRWFRRGQAWRAGIEPRIATLKHRFGMQRAFYKGEAGFERHVAFCVLAHNLVAMSRAGPR
jgi:IS5 family transposase